MLNILWKKNTAGIFVLILLAAGTFTLSGVTVSNLVRGQTNSNNTSEIQATVSTEPQPEIQHEQQQEKEVQQAGDVQRPNHPPKAIAGSDKKVKEETNVILDARRSSDPDGDQVTYLWRLSSGPRVAIENATSTVASFVAPEVNRDASLTFALTVRDDKGVQDMDSVKVSIRNVDSNINNNVGTSQNNGNTNTNTNANTNSNSNPTGTTTTTTSPPASLDNTTSQALLNMQNTIRNNGSRATTPNPSETQLSKATVFTPQAISSGVAAIQASNIVNTRTAYDIIFRTASAGVIATMDITFPTGTNLAGRQILEVSGIGLGSSTISGQTLKYIVANPVSVPAGVYIRLEIWNINNPTIPAANLAVQVTTRDAGGSEIDSGTSVPYLVKQIGTGDIADSAVTTAKIQDGQVGTADIAGNAVTGAKISTDAVTADEISGMSKLIFATCSADPPDLGPGVFTIVNCPVNGAASGDNVIVTNNGYVACECASGSLYIIDAFTQTDNVVLIYKNDGTTGLDSPPQGVSMIVFQP